MKYTAFQLNAMVTDLAGEEAKILNNEQTAVISFNVRTAFRKALNGVFQDESGQTPLPFEKKIKRYEISKKIWEAEAEVTLSTEENAELKLCVGKLFNSPEICGFLEKIMEGKDKLSNSDDATDDKKKKRN